MNWEAAAAIAEVLGAITVERLLPFAVVRVQHTSILFLSIAELNYRFANENDHQESTCR
jgi:hypothetical protein